ncbi:MAG: DUF4234 domain-containing protein [Defluviitaleaceae bacterium]|nr:DUF4234 domain-containing protein [Defluviitaleaceae bacterium]
MHTTIKNDRQWWIVLLLSMVTCSIYGIWWFWKVGEDVNAIIGGRDGERTINYVLMWFLGILTFGISTIVWFHLTTKRIEGELAHRGFSTGEFNVSTYWKFSGIPSIVLQIISIGYLVYYFIAILPGIFSDPLFLLFNTNYLLGSMLFNLATIGISVLYYIYIHRLCVAMNRLADDYNHKR